MKHTRFWRARSTVRYLRRLVACGGAVALLSGCAAQSPSPTTSASASLDTPAVVVETPVSTDSPPAATTQSTSATTMTPATPISTAVPEASTVEPLSVPPTPISTAVPEAATAAPPAAAWPADWLPQPRAVVTGQGEGAVEGTLSVVNTDGSNGYRVGSVSFLRDGYDLHPGTNRIAFAHAATGTYSIYITSAADAQPTELAKGTSPHWSPDGQMLAFIGEDSKLVLTALDASAPQQLISEGRFYNFFWAPDSQHIAYMRCAANDVMCNGQTLVVIDRATTQHQDIISPDLGINSFAWSPDSTTLVFDSLVNESYNGIYRVNRDGSGLQQIMQESAYGPQWSPDGRFISYSTTDNNIVVITADSNREVYHHAGKYVVWSPQGTFFAIVGDYENGSTVAIVRTAQFQEVRSLDGYNPVWAADEAYLSFFSYRAGGKGMYVVAADGSNEMRVLDTKNGFPWLAGG